MSALVAGLLVGAFGAATVSAQEDDGGELPGLVAGEYGVFFPWVANDDESTGLGPADTSITLQNLSSEEVTVLVYRGIGSGGLGGENGWELIAPFMLEGLASKTFSAEALGLEPGEGAPIAASGFLVDVPEAATEDYNEDGDSFDFETIADDDFFGGANSWMNVDIEDTSWEDGACLLVDDDDGDGIPENVAIADSPATEGVQFPGQGGANLDGNPADCTASEFGDAVPTFVTAPIAGVAKQAVDGENLPMTSEVDTAVSGYHGLAGQELIEVGNTEGPFNGWYLPIVQTNGGPGGAWNSIIRIANFGDGGIIGAAGVNVTIYPYDDAAGELNQSFTLSETVNAGETWTIDISDHVPEGFIGSAHISADAPVFAMVDRVKVGYNEWLTNTASNAAFTAQEGLGLNFPDKFVLFAPDVRKDFFGWNTGINVANLADSDNTVTIQYYGDIGAQAETRTIHSKGMTFFYDPSQTPQDNSQQDPTTDPNPEAIGAAIIIADQPVAATVDATKYPESTTEEDPNVFQALSYSATQNLWPDQAVPLAQKGNPDDGMGATSGIQIFNPFDQTTTANVHWFNSAGDTVGNVTPAVINPNAMTFVYSMNDAQIPVGFLGSAIVQSTLPVSVVSTQVDYQVEFDGSAVWNGYNPGGTYRTFFNDAPSYLDGIVTLGDEAAEGVEVSVFAAGACGPDGEVLYSGTTDASGVVAIDVEPGDYCVSADPNGDEQPVTAETTVDEFDAIDDVDFELNEEEGSETPTVAFLDGMVSADGSPAVGATVNVFPAGQCDADDPLYTGSTTTGGLMSIEVEPGDYCVSTDANGDQTPTTSDNVTVEEGDPADDGDFTINDVTPV